MSFAGFSDEWIDGFPERQIEDYLEWRDDEELKQQAEDRDGSTPTWLLDFNAREMESHKFGTMIEDWIEERIANLANP